ncbi:MAG: hypothetical protein AB7P04_14930, partial [Bacteriovoracia bacterium]
MIRNRLASATALLGVLFFAATPTAYAVKFANQFVEFEMPPRWACNLEGAEWVCQSSDADKKRDAIIILAAKMKGDQDSVEAYLAYLKQPKVYTSLRGKTVKSEVRFAESKMINDHMWVDSLHLESEIPGFFTRYMATTKNDIGALVTYSINKDKYSLYVNDFDAMVKTLRVFRKTGGLNAKPAEGNLFDLGSTIPSKISDSSVFSAADDDEPKAKPKKEDDTFFYLIIGLVAVVGFIIWRRRQQ